MVSGERLSGVTAIPRDVSAESWPRFDVIVVGAGIYGAMLCLEASLRGLRVLLLEREDFGGATSFNSLRIIHGGFRYLQDLDLKRFYESVGERRWFFRCFPDLVQPLTCLMPLYNNGLRRPFIMRAGLKLNDVLSRHRNIRVASGRHLPGGAVIGPDQVRTVFPGVDPQGLAGGAVWHDGFAPDTQRVIMETLRWACREGAVALNYVEADSLLQSGGRVQGVRATDRIRGTAAEFHAETVINAAGPWCREVASRFDRDHERLFRSVLAWNVLLDRSPLSDHALAVAPKKPGARTYFLVPWKGRVMAGTGHARWLSGSMTPRVTDELMGEFLDDLNLAIPQLNVGCRDVLRILPGLQPGCAPDRPDLSRREVIIDHATCGGPRGLFSLSGVKFTTARLVAEKSLRRIFGVRNGRLKSEVAYARPDVQASAPRGVIAGLSGGDMDGGRRQAHLRSLAAEESVQHLDDLVLRRTDLWSDPRQALDAAPELCRSLDWGSGRCEEEILRLRQTLLPPG
jgi:glycerol-3-phosphate dehydrogenase